VEEQPRHHGAHDDAGDGRMIELVLLAGKKILREHGEHRDPDAGCSPTAVPVKPQHPQHSEVVECERDAPDRLCMSM
jgi:hypothetical protein